MKAPPSNGPTTLATPNTAPIRPCHKGLFFKDTTAIITMIAPFIMPALPRPAIARPTMNMDELVAAPQTAEPTSKTTIAKRRTDFGESKGFARHPVDASL